MAEHPMIAQLRRIRNGLAKAAQEIRAASPKCPKCGKPTGGIIQAHQTKETAGLCICKEATGGAK